MGIKKEEFIKTVSIEHPRIKLNKVSELFDKFSEDEVSIKTKDDRSINKKRKRKSKIL